MNANERIVAIVQARMNASRLPGKVLKDIAGKPMLEWVISRTKQSKIVNEIVVATTTDPSDDAIEKFCEAIDVACFRGSSFDVLDRYYQAAQVHHADVVVRITADCPLLDPSLIDEVITELQKKNLDFSANRLPPPWKRTYPLGLDVEVCRMAALEKAWKEAEKPFEREHVMPYLYDQEGRFKISVVNTEKTYPDQRWTVDTPEDLEMMRKAYDHFKDINKFGWLEVLNYFEKHPEVGRINAGVSQKTALEQDARYKK